MPLSRPRISVHPLRSRDGRRRNPQSFLDIFSLFRLFRPFKFVSKTSVFMFPIVGWSMFLTGHIGLKRTDRRSQVGSTPHFAPNVRRRRRATCQLHTASLSPSVSLERAVSLSHTVSATSLRARGGAVYMYSHTRYARPPTKEWSKWLCSLFAALDRAH